MHLVLANSEDRLCRPPRQHANPIVRVRADARDYGDPDVAIALRQLEATERTEAIVTECEPSAHRRPPAACAKDFIRP
jgi:hypothetical protein